MNDTPQPAYPRPEPDPDSLPYWNALREGRVLVQRCAACGKAQLYFRAICRYCWSRDLTPEQASGTGTVYSYSVVHTVGDPALAAEVPYALAIVELNEGPRVMTRIEGDPEVVRIGDRVRASFRDIGDDVTLLHFTREAADAR
ncbi:MAG: Zn-ribbon domain-containing OB-fold protein [Acetobacteraceae bacterium]|nr:Zn-ribbon domain-containing OB-fold protein [Acetobacteraceae bacterium]